MKKQLVLFLVCLFCFSALNNEAQIKPGINRIQVSLPEIQANPWDLDYQIKIQNLQNPQFADVIRKRFLRNKFSVPKSDQSIEGKILIGEARIKAGKASTTFKYNPNLSLKDYLLLSSDSYELRQIVEKNAEVCLKMFRQKLKEHHLAQNDIVDSGALAFVISYEIYFGEKPSKSHLNWMRKKGRDILLKLPSFQGVGDAERQKTFEIFGVLTMYAKLLQQRGLRGDTESLAESRETAGEVLKEVWGSSIDSIQILPVGFIHKGQKMILDNRATHTFIFNPNRLTAKKLSRGNPEIETQYQSFLAQIYTNMAEKEVPNNDLAACGAYSFSVVFPLASGVEKLNKDQSEAVSKVFRQAVLNSADIQAASDENKQMACEVFAIRAVLFRNEFSDNSDANLVKPLAEQFIIQLFRAYGEDYKNYQLTSNNFVKLSAGSVSTN